MAYYLLPEKDQKRFRGHAGFQDAVPGVRGSGIAGYSQRPGYRGYDTPTKVGARYFFPEPDYDDTSDQPVPAATGNKWDGGGEAYRTRVYKAAKSVGKKQGLTDDDVDSLEPTKQLAAMGPRKVA